MGTVTSTLECSICNEYLREPRVLDCLHCFCQKCLQELCKCQNIGGSKIRCSVIHCRKETTVNEVTDLPTYTTSRALVDEAMMHEILEKEQGSKIKCQACDEENRALSRCMDCDYFLCHKCQKAHERLAMLKSHKIYTIAQLRSGQIAYKSKLRDYVKTCSKHQDQQLNTYCNTCQQLLCTTCFMLNHNSAEHKVVGLSEALEKCRQDVTEQTVKAEQIKTNVIIAMNENDDSLKEWEIKCADINRKISKKVEEELAKIKEKEKRLKNELRGIYQKKVKKTEAAQAINSTRMNQAECKLDVVRQHMEHGSCYEILEFKQKLLKSVKESMSTSKQPVRLPDNMFFMSFEESKKSTSIGRLVFEDKTSEKQTVTVPILFDESIDAEDDECSSGNIVSIDAEDDENSSGSMDLEDEEESDIKVEAVEPQIVRGKDPNERWIFKTQTKIFGSEQTNFEQIYDVAVFSNNDIIVVDKTHKQLMKSVIISKPESPVNSRRLDLAGITEPSHVSINSNNQLIVLDGHHVKIFSKECKFVSQFKPGNPHNSKPTCLAVDDDNVIAVGFKYDKEISLHKPDGSLFRKLQVQMICEHLTMCKQQLIFTTYWSKLLSSVDYSGVKVFSVRMASLMQTYGGPNGVCCDRAGSIYVAVRGVATSSGEIHHFSPEGKYIGCIIGGHPGCGTPWGITMTPDDNNLVVAAKFSVKAFRCVLKTICH